MIGSLLTFSIRETTEHTKEILLSQARPFMDQILITRLWSAGHGGVYVPVTESSPPNPYLKVPERDIETASGRKLTLINPAYMTRQISELSEKLGRARFHLTSDHPIRPENYPEPWELEAIKTFSKPGDSQSSRAVDEEGRPVFRYIEPVWAKKECLQCHGAYGYKEGDLRGALSVTVPAGPAIHNEKESIKFGVTAYTIVWLLGMLGLGVAGRELRKRSQEQDVLIDRLENTLQGLVPICASCKSIRNESGEWESLEGYISERSEAEFSHDICPVCSGNLYGDFLNDTDEQEKR